MFAITSRSARTGIKRPEGEFDDGSTFKGSDNILEAPIGSAEECVMDSVLGRHRDVERNEVENRYMCKSAHCPRQGKTGKSENEFDQVAKQSTTNPTAVGCSWTIGCATPNEIKCVGHGRREVPNRM